MQEPTYMEGCNDKGYLISKKCSKQISLGLKKNMHTWFLLNLALKQKKSRCLQLKYENGLNDFHIAHFTTMICSIKNHFHISALDTYIPTCVKKLGEICPIIQQVSSIIFFPIRLYIVLDFHLFWRNALAGLALNLQFRG